jgi:hypothetical protein
MLARREANNASAAIGLRAAGAESRASGALLGEIAQSIGPRVALKMLARYGKQDCGFRSEDFL